MSLKRIVGSVSVASLFAILILWGYLPRVWVMGWPQLVCLGLSAATFVAWVILNLGDFLQWMKRRSARFGIGMALTAVSVTAILAAVNWTAVQYSWKKDLTKNKMHTLSDQTLKVLGTLQQEVTVRVWTMNLQRMSTNVDLKQFFENYQTASKGKLKLEIKNPNDDRGGAEQDRITRDNVIIVKTASGREARVENFAEAKAEEQVTNALLQATKSSGQKKVVCFSAGHGELGLDDQGPKGLSKVKESLTAASYESRTVILATEGKVPTDCDLLVLVGPQGAPLAEEFAYVKAFLLQGKSVLALIGPGGAKEWSNLAADFGVTVDRNVVIDPRVRPPVAVATQNFAKDVDVVKAFDRLVLFPESSSITVGGKTTDQTATVKTFISSENYTYAKASEIKNLTPAMLGKVGTDRKGPLALAVLINKKLTKSDVPVTPPTKKGAEKKKPAQGSSASLWQFLVSSAYAQDGHFEGDGHDHSHDQGPPGKGEAAAPPAGEVVENPEMNLMVIGNHTFLANGVVPQFGNMDLFLNAVSYLAKDSSAIGIRPREMSQAKLELSQESLNQVAATIFLLAGVFVVGGVYAGLRRRTMS